MHQERREDLIPEYARDSRQKRREEDAQLRASVQHGLVIRKAAIDSGHIQIMVDRNTPERWVRIINVDKNDRTAVKLALKQAGIQTAVPSKSDGNGSDGVILFSAIEARKLLL
ncbi:MAG: hypothetical protein ACLQGP_20680 [Isosphaeraceae bacterium]